MAGVPSGLSLTPTPTFKMCSLFLELLWSPNQEDEMGWMCIVPSKEMRNTQHFNCNFRNKEVTWEGWTQHYNGTGYEAENLTKVIQDAAQQWAPK